jgi:DNA-binding winged helix-turn-helix (wHTH) protein
VNTTDTELPPSDQAPGLTAAVYYLRPFSRDTLLASLASLGVFVHEQRGDASGIVPPGGTDLAIVVARPGDADMVRALSRHAPILAIVSSPRLVRDFARAGARLCALDADVIGAPAEVLAPAARLARQIRDGGHPVPPLAAPTVEFGGAVFSSESCALICGSTRIPLSRAERDILSRLAADRGVPVRSEALASAAQIRTFPTSRYLASIIVSLRRKLRRLGADADALATVHGVGYVLLGPDRSGRGGS